jgi:hypothetical protein
MMTTPYEGITAVDKWPAYARLWAVAPADYLPTAPTLQAGTRPIIPKRIWRHRRLLKNFSAHLKEVLASTTAATPVEIWFQDEARVGQRGSLSYV